LREAVRKLVIVRRPCLDLSVPEVLGTILRKRKIVMKLGIFTDR
jgi:hypothetical protein